jgi:hypothetical protein
MKMVELGRSIVLDDTLEWIRVHVYGYKPSAPASPVDDKTKRVQSRRSPRRKEKKRHMWKKNKRSRESDEDNDDDDVDEGGDDVDSDDDVDEEGGGDYKEQELKRLKRMRQLWAKRRAKSDVSQKLPARHRGKMDGAHTVGDVSGLMIERAESCIDAIPQHHQQNSSTTDDEDERKALGLSDAGVIKTEKVALSPCVV